MEIFLVVLPIFALVCIGMGIGYLVKGKPLKGSCGGLNNLNTKDGKSFCEICGATGEEKKLCD
ncbi:MAG: hypothetical protein CMP10_19755 [Zetaproteobacteria bacterium]|nr:hypothetical protein [Pseudobdellovibrionaceae bacterium]